jgi:hypothetical protein
LTAHPRKQKSVKKVCIDKEFRRIAEKNLRRDLELLERLAKILVLIPHRLRVSSSERHPFRTC